MPRERLHLDFELLERACWDANANWIRWRDDYMFASNSEWKCRPLLSEPKRFQSFLGEYGLLRTIRLPNRQGKPHREKQLETLMESIAKIGPCPDPVSLQIWGSKISRSAKYYECEPNVGISLCSKIMCFANPIKFPPCDRFNKKGIKQVMLGQPRYSELNNYEFFQRSFEELLADKELSSRITEWNLQIAGDPGDLDKLNARALDLYLMFCGGFGPPSRVSSRSEFSTGFNP